MEREGGKQGRLPQARFTRWLPPPLLARLRSAPRALPACAALDGAENLTCLRVVLSLSREWEGGERCWSWGFLEAEECARERELMDSPPFLSPLSFLPFPPPSPRSHTLFPLCPTPPHSLLLLHPDSSKPLALPRLASPRFASAADTSPALPTTPSTSLLGGKPKNAPSYPKRTPHRNVTTLTLQKKLLRHAV